MELPKYERKCENWLATFREWTLDRCESAESFVFWTGLYCLSASVRRRIFIGKKYLGAWTCYPHCYIMFVGPAGMRKTTTMGFAIDLLDQVPSLTKGSTFITQTAMVDTIMKSPDASMYMTVEEFGDIILKGGFEMFEFLTSMFDGKKNLEQKTMLRGIEFANKPCINMLAATTPEWIAANMPESVIGGGFASRVLFQQESTTRMKKLFFRKQLITSPKNYDKLEQDLISDLTHIAMNIEGEFELEEEAEDWLEAWNQKHDFHTGNKKIAGFMNRKVTHILKIAQLVHIAYSDILKINKQDFEAAIEIVEALEVNLPKVFAGVGKNQYSLDMRDIVSYVAINPGVILPDLKNVFQNAATPSMLEELIFGLLEMNELKSELGPGGKLKLYIVE